VSEVQGHLPLPRALPLADDDDELPLHIDSVVRLTSTHKFRSAPPKFAEFPSIFYILATFSSRISMEFLKHELFQNEPESGIRRSAAQYMVNAIFQDERDGGYFLSSFK
jgi:hypothetical protein